MWSQNHAYTELREPTLGRPYLSRSYPNLGHVKRHLCSRIFLQVHDKTDTRVSWFFVKKIKKRSYFCVNEFCDFIKIHKIWLLSKQKKNMSSISEKKNSFSFCFFLEVGWCFILNKRKKNFRWLKIGKKNWHVWNEMLKKYSVENDKKKGKFSFTKKCLFE